MARKPIVRPVKTGTPDSILSSIYHKILIDLNIDIVAFNYLMDQYILKSGLNEYNMKKVTIRGNIKKELLSDKMTWKNFIKGLNFLRVYKFDINIRLYHRNNKVTEHSRTIILDGEHDDPSDDQSE